MTKTALQQLLTEKIAELVSEDGFHASGKEEIFGCLFGRDSAITMLKLMRVYEKNPSIDFLSAIRKTLDTLTALQGTEFNFESGEEPGKIIHEYRPNNYERLLQKEKPWYVYPGVGIKNYDSIDSTPLTLIALYRYWQITGDDAFLLSKLTNIEAGLNWIISYGDRDKDLFLEYELPQTRKHGGLMVQSWTDSRPSLYQKDGTFPLYPIAPVEVQAIAWLALRLWGDFYLNNYGTYNNPAFGKKLVSQAGELKKEFNKQFLLESNGNSFAAQALDGTKTQIKTITGNPLICLWAAYKTNDKTECIIEDKYLNDFVKRGMQDDLFVPTAGIRTMSTFSPTFNPNQDSYHNGSFWPVLNGFISEGLENFGYEEEATQLKEASLKPIQHFGTPIELYVEKEGTYLPYQNEKGQISCFNQAWSAAASLDWVTS